MRWHKKWQFTSVKCAAIFDYNNNTINYLQQGLRRKLLKLS